jgi:hypothetical protein
VFLPALAETLETKFQPPRFLPLKSCDLANHIGVLVPDVPQQFVVLDRERITAGAKIHHLAARLGEHRGGMV